MTASSSATPMVRHSAISISRMKLGDVLPALLTRGEISVHDDSAADELKHPAICK